MLELYHDWDSLMSFKVRACLAEKQLDWTPHLIELTEFKHLEAEYLRLNPNGVVPTLVHDGHVVIESSVINEYLDEVFQEPSLRPTDPVARAHMRAWVKYGDDVLHHGVRPATFEMMIKQRLKRFSKQELEALIAHHPQPARAQAFRKAAAEDIDFDQVNNTVVIANTAFARMEASLKEGDWLVADQFSLADVMAMSFIDRITHLGLAFLIDRRPSVRDWADRLMNRSSYKSSVPPPGTRLPTPDADAIERLKEIFNKP
ncbi:MAG: stringent starvation protein A [marine bacterium B5-7]|nr:MAG: stringent starvation protein A [marine bacterium B5-7]